MSGARDLFEVRAERVSVGQILENACRLDSSAFLGTGGQRHARLSSEQGTRLDGYADVFTVYIQSPILAYVRPSSTSRPYLTTSELGEYQNRPPAEVSLVADPRLIAWEIKRNYLLISRSGRVGEVYAADSKLAGALVGDCFRVAPKRDEDRGWLYAFLKSPLAAAHFDTSTYGSVVDHASVEQVRSLIVPRLTDAARRHVGEAVDAAFTARERSYSILAAAESELAAVTKLPPFSAIEETLRSGSDGGQSELVPILDVLRGDLGDTELRLDGHYHNPIARKIVDVLRGSTIDISGLGRICARVILGPRFKRNYVVADHGTPFLSGKNIVQIRPSDLKFLSHSQVEELGDIVLERGWTLVTCSGTIGRTCFVWDNYEGYAASQHILRIVPNEGLVDPGYLYSFLSSPYGYEQVLRFRHGSVIDEVTDEQIKKVLVPLPSRDAQRAIGDLARAAYSEQADALRLENEAQELLMNEISVRLNS